jgi:beta-glucuronidase
MDRELELIQELGVNLIRLVHYPHHPGFLERCDREGIMTWCEIPLYQAGMAPVKYLSAKKSAGRESGVTKILRLPGMIFRTRQASDPKLISRSRDSLLRMIERDCNHPSIRFWGIGNECWTLNPAGARALRRLKETAESSDRSRLPGYAAMTIPGLTEKFERSFRVMDFIGINEYFGWYYGETRDTEGFLRRLSRGFPGKPLLVTETGADCARGVRNGQQEPERGVSEEYQSRFLREQLSAVSGVPAAAGVCVWVLKDFLCPEYGAENPVPFHNAKGLIDREYRKKASFDTVKGIFRKEEKGE